MIEWIPNRKLSIKMHLSPRGGAHPHVDLRERAHDGVDGAVVHQHAPCGLGNSVSVARIWGLTGLMVLWSTSTHLSVWEIAFQWLEGFGV